MKAGLAACPQDYAWSSAAAHLHGRNDQLTTVVPLPAIIKDWARFLAEPQADDLQARLERHERTGRPLGNQAFLARLETTLHRPLAPAKPGRKPRLRTN